MVAPQGWQFVKGKETMTLSEKQQLFTQLIAQLISWAGERGYRLTFGEAYRTPEQAKLNAKAGTGISNSLHTSRLAVDFNLFINGVYQTKSEAFLPLGEYWESLGGTWGGRFKSNPDGNHFSLEHNGVR
ncbi:phage-like protein [Yersinia enterocolitica]|nr:phage-like protein [Yersinia enterocolitica]